ncbi:hypothetical protein NLJ89_g1294 [Agrocybe chaxingu]|uniref:Uncharacterized protein n=1 Tax=Agrocybe chaxingu TaxID=84603 RepID=A0A9W8N0D2_9AGAR|nr:hypothetical protein NLJ89_g1294 [Agrocybe chaxingu]
MAEQLVNGEHPLALELKSLRAAVGRFQEEAHASALKLQRHSLDVSKVQQRAVQLERESEVLRSELHVLRTTPHPDADPSSPPSTQIQELTLSLRRLSHKLTLTEESLLSKTTELATTHANLTKSRAALEEAYALGARVRGREEAGLARERDAEWKIKRLEEEKKMTDGVLGEYARLVRSLEAKLASARTSVTSPTTPDTPEIWKENGHARTSSTSSISEPLSSSLLDATFNLKQLTSQFQSGNEALHREVERLRAELEVANSKLEGEKKGEKTVLAEFGRAKAELEKLRIEDGSAAKMVARYMQFSQSSTNTLLNTLSALKTRHAATLATLSEQNNELSLQRKSLESENEVLRDRLDEVGAELAKEVYGRRREVGLRIKMGGREEGVREGLGRWVRRGEEALKRLGTAQDGEARESEEMQALLAMSQDARILLASLDEGLFDAETALTASGAKARGILLEAGLDGLLDELKAESERTAKAECHLIELKAMVAKVSAAMDEAAAIAGQEMEDQEDLAKSLQDSSRNSIPVYPDEPPQPPPKAFDRLVDSKTQPEEKVEEPPALSSGLVTVHDTPPSTNTANDTFLTHDTATDAPSSSGVRPRVSPDPELASSVPPSSDDGHISTFDTLTDVDKPGAPTPNKVAHFIPEPSTFIPISAEPPLPEAAEPDPDPAAKVPPPPEVEVEMQVDAPVVVPTISANLEVAEALQVTEDILRGGEISGATDLEEQETTPMTETAGLDKDDMQQTTAISTISFLPTASSSSVVDIANQEDEDQPQTTTGPTDNTNTVAFPIAPPAAPAPPSPTDPAPKLGDGVVPPSIAEKTLPDAPAPSVGELPPEFPSVPVVPPAAVPIVAPAPLEPARLLNELQNPACELIELEPEATPPPAPHPLLAELSKVSKRYDDLQCAFRDCHLALEGLKTSLASSSASKTFTPSVGVPREILDAAVGRLDDYTEDVRVELEIKVGDEELLAKGYEALLSVPGALSSSNTKNTGGDDDDPPTQLEAEAQIQAFVSGSDPAVRKARETFERKLGDVQHDIAQLKRAVHDPESLHSSSSAPPVSVPDLSSTSSLTSPQPTKPDTGGWTSWIRGSPSTSRPSSPAPPTTFGNIMTNPRLRHSPSLGAGQLQSNGHGYANDHQQQQAQDSRSRRGSFFGLNLGGGEKEKSTDPLTSLGLRVPMPSFASFSSFNSANPVSPPPSSSSSPFGFGAFHSAVSPTFNYGGLGVGTPTPTRTRTVSTMYMLGLSSPGSATGPGRMSRSVSGSGSGSPLGMSRQTSLSSQSSQSVAKKGAEREVKRVSEEVGEETDEDESEDDDDLDVE